MRKIILIPTLLFWLFTTLNAQDTLPPKPRFYKAVVFTDAKHSSSGYLASISDSSLSVSPTRTSLTAYEINENDYFKVPYNSISKVRLKRKGAVGRGVLIGGLIGFSAGAISGLAAGDDPPCRRPVRNPYDIYGINLFFDQMDNAFCEGLRRTASQKALGRGILGAFGGALVGSLVGALAHKTFIIGRDKQKLHEMKSKLLH